MADSAPPGLGPVPWDLQRARCFTWAEKLTLIVLWGRCNAQGTCFTSLTELAADMPASLNTTRAAVNSLEEQGLIGIAGKNGARRTYLVSPEAIESYINTHTPTKSGTGEQVVTPTKSGTGPLPKTTGDPYQKRQGTPTKIGTQSIPIRNTHKVNPEEKPVARRKSAPPSVSGEFVERMVAKFGGRLSREKVCEEIDAALNHTSAKKWGSTELYVSRWLSREAERLLPRQQGPPRSLPPVGPPISKNGSDYVSERLKGHPAFKY